MKTLKKCRLLLTGLIAALLLLAVGVLGLGGISMTAYAHEEEIVRDGYTVDDIRDMLEENNSFKVDHEWLTIYNEDGTMGNIQVPCDTTDEQFSNSTNSQTSANFDVHEIIHSGRANSQSIVVTILGDGFTSTQQADFIDHATTTANFMIGYYPFTLFKDYFNIYAVEVHSNESGVSRDRNTWAQAQNHTVDNYFGSRFWHDGVTDRLLYITRESRVPSLVQSNSAMTVILANSTTYGGAGGTYAVGSIHSNSSRIMVHELGHSFGGLWDEYWNGLTYSNSYPNVTNNTNASTVKWSQWVGYNNTGHFQICTNASCTSVQSCNHGSSGWYRPHQSCIMRTLGNPFCPVCSHALIGKMEAKAGTLFNTTNLSGNNIRIDKLNLSVKGSFSIPERINGRVVTELGTSSFANCTQLSQITIPASVNSIGLNAFQNCTSLTTVTFLGTPTLQTIGNSAFANCIQLTQISIPPV